MERKIAKVDPCKNCGAHPKDFKLQYVSGNLVGGTCTYCGMEVDLPWREIYMAIIGTRLYDSIGGATWNDIQR